jgi:hypothetical protein
MSINDSLDYAETGETVYELQQEDYFKPDQPVRNTLRGAVFVFKALPEIFRPKSADENKGPSESKIGRYWLKPEDCDFEEEYIHGRPFHQKVIQAVGAFAAFAVAYPYLKISSAIGGGFEKDSLEEKVD